MDETNDEIRLNLTEIEQDVELDLRLGQLHPNWAKAILYLVQTCRTSLDRQETASHNARHYADEAFQMEQDANSLKQKMAELEGGGCEKGIPCLKSRDG